MRVCVFSDIHGNGPAFEAAFKKILSEKADVNVFLGDLCGYYYDQMAIFHCLKAIPDLISLKGNHDALFLDMYYGDEDARKDYLKQYGKSMEKLLEADCAELASWLGSLPDSVSWDESGGVCFYHGSPWAPRDGYVYPDAPLKIFESLVASVFVLGNTHYPMHRRTREKIIINPGSLGQPRHSGWPSYAVVDLPSGNVLLREVHYDKKNILQQIEKIERDNEYLWRVLFRHD